MIYRSMKFYYQAPVIMHMLFDIYEFIQIFIKITIKIQTE